MVHDAWVRHHALTVIEHFKGTEFESHFNKK